MFSVMLIACFEKAMAMMSPRYPASRKALFRVVSSVANSIQCPISFLSHRRFKKEVYATSISKPSACKNSPACYLYAASPGPHESSPPVDT